MRYDCFIFYNELDLLEIRLNELDDVIDEFVLVEGEKTFQGDNKKLYFEENKERFEEFEHKINHVIVSDYPDGIFERSPWEVEYYTRNSIMDGLQGASSEDTVVFSDIDEIPKSETIKTLDPSGSIYVFETKFFYYFLNCIREDKNLRWTGPILLSYGALQNTSPTNLRGPLASTELTNYYKIPKPLIREFWALAMSVYLRKRVKVISNAGWHFSYQGGIDAIIDKIESFSATHFNKEEYKDKERIRSAMGEGEDLFGRDHSFEFVEIDGSFPDYIINNMDEFQHMIFE